MSGPLHPPAVSIVIPAYNAAATLVPAVQSAVTQLDGTVEIIIVDDASTDETRRIADDLARRYPQITVTGTATNSGGVGRPRNIGVDRARGHYVMFLDSDDQLPPQACQALVRTAERTGADITVGKAVRVNVASGATKDWTPEVCRTERMIGDIREWPVLLRDPLAANKLFRRDFLDKFQLRFPEGVHFEDTPFSTQAYVYAGRIALVPEVVYRWRYSCNSPNPSITNQINEIRSFRDRIAMHRLADSFLIQQNARDLKLHKDLKFLAHDLMLYVRRLRDREQEYHDDFIRLAAEYLALMEPEAFARCAPVERVCAFFLAQGDLPGLLTVADFAQQRSLLSTDLVRSEGRVYWTGRYLDQPDARSFLDVTALRLDAWPRAALLHNRATALEVDGSVVHFSALITGQFGWVRPRRPLRLRVVIRDQASGREWMARAEAVTVAHDRIQYQARLDLATAISRVPAETRVWNMAVQLAGRPRRHRTPLSIYGIDARCGEVHLPGGSVEWYRTINGNFALRRSG